MIVSKLILRQCRFRGFLHGFAPQVWNRRSSTAKAEYHPYKKIIGNREIVGFGFNSNPSYIDMADFPFPSIRYRESTPELMAMREKERGDWKKLSICEKKCLYRASFRQTFAEFGAPKSDWKTVVGGVLMCFSFALWYNMYCYYLVFKSAPESFSPESRIAQYYRQVDINNLPFTGNFRPPGAELRIHPKNKEMLEMLKDQPR